MKVSAFELWLIRNDPEIREVEAPKHPLGLPILAHSGAPFGGVMLSPHKRRCIALTGRDDKRCVCARVADDAPPPREAADGQ